MSKKSKPTYRVKSVLRALCTERAYQEKKWGEPNHSTGEWLMIMRKVLADAERAWQAGHGTHDEIMNEIRQLTAVGLAAMEQHGAPERTGPTAVRKFPMITNCFAKPFLKIKKKTLERVIKESLGHVAMPHGK